MAIFKGSKGSTGTFKQTPDNLRSNDTFEAVMGVAIGPLKGPTNGLKSLTIDGTAIENATGQMNLNDFVVNIGDGDPAQWPQKINLKLGAGAAPTQVGLSLTNPNVGTTPPTGPGPWVTKTLANTNADFIDIRFIAQQLFSQTKSGIFNATATIEIQLKPTSSTTWVNPTIGTPSGTYSPTGVTTGNSIKTLIPQSFYTSTGAWKAPVSNYQITGKTTSAAVYELRLGVPNEGVYANVAWDIRCRLIERETYDSDPNYEKRTISWESIAAVYGGVLGDHVDWRGVAWLQMYGKASDQLTGVPDVSGEWDTKIVSCPATVFNPTTRQYTGAVWDGSWQKAFTTDPAWIINDALSDSLSGVSLVAPGSYLNKWDALDCSKWCSALVSDGNGGTQPRYSMNLAINDPSKAEEFIRYLAGAVGGLAWDQGDGMWRMKMDKPDVPVDLFTLESVEGEFVYSNTDVDTRYNDITIKFKNADMMYRQDTVRLYDNASIAKIGRKPITIVAVGCTNRQEAMRRGLLRLRSTINETRIINFTTNRRGRNLEMLDMILVADGDLGDKTKRTTGRIVSISADRLTITVRDPMRLEIGVNYQLDFTVPYAGYAPDTTVQPSTPDWKKPTIVTQRAVTNASGARGNVTVITLDQALPADLPDNLSVALTATNLVTLPKTYRITNMVMNDDGERISISALEVDMGKWDAADNVSKSDTVFQDLRGAVPAPLPPTNGVFLSIVKVPIDQGYQTNLVANWVRPSGAFISGFQVGYRINGGAFKVANESTQESTYELVNPAAGSYQFEVRTLDRRGGVSAALTGTILLTQDQLSASDIKYADQKPIEFYKPAEPGATKGLGNELLAGMTAQQVVDSLNFNANSIAQEILRGDSLQGLIAARTLINGKDVGTVINDFKTQQTGVNSAYANTLSLLGASNSDGTAFLFNSNTAITENGMSVGQRLASTEATLGTQSGSISNLESVVIDKTGASVRSVFQLNSNGYISGIIQTNNGVGRSEVAFLADIFKVVSSAGGTPFTPFSIESGIVKMPNVEVGTIKIGAISSDSLALGAVTRPMYWQQSYGGVSGKTAFSAPSEGVWYEFGATGAKATTGPIVLPIGSSAQLSFQFNAQQQAGNPDVHRFRVKRVDGSGTTVYLASSPAVRLTNSIVVSSWTWMDVGVPAAGTYTYTIEFYRNPGEGIYWEAALSTVIYKR